MLRPGRLTDEPGTGRVRTDLGSETQDRTIPRADVAETLVALLEEPAASRTIPLFSGETPIRDALAPG
ncbi:MAG TPA: NAD(P)H-binding protein [Polyangiaceae bacterium LLY-WYZ-14_1]|nr:NAD(P)H-binding protein [Polyangiaceae bacterium LLY-WYZ-14_1]